MAERVAVVLAGGGARGAYEAGALSVLLPALEREGRRPDIVVGTSVGALNGAFLAATAHLPVDEVCERALAIWGSIDYDQVLEPLASAGSAARLLGYVGQALGVPKARVWSVLDPSPLERTLPGLVDFRRLRRNVAEGRVHAAAVVATSARTGRSVVFHQGGEPDDPHDDKRGIDYVTTRLDAAHVRASAAIPALFPAVEIGSEWYSDGGTRLNTPIKPALALGADRVVVVALNSTAPADHPDRPDALVGAGSILQSLLADQLLADVGTLRTVNELLGGRARAGRRPVPHLVVAPQEPDTLGGIAADVFHRYYGHLRGLLRDGDVAALGRAVDGDADPAHGELLSYLFFAPEFTRELLRLGRRDAERVVASGSLWTTGG